MSKQSDAKAAQGYVANPTPNTCANCQHFRSDLVLATWMVEANASDFPRSTPRYVLPANGSEKNLRCNLGGFAVKKSGTCNRFIPKETA